MPSANLAAIGCWAAALGECSKKISGEHLISKSLFDDDAVIVQGFTWCLEQPKTIGLSSLVGNILCRKHNSDLSCLDSVALETFNAFRESVKITNARKGLNTKSWTLKRFVVNGASLERWFLKTLINLSFGGEWIIGMGSHPKGTPSKDLVETAFGLREFRDGSGLYLAGQSGDQIDSRDGITFTPKTSGRNLVVGAFQFRGFKFYLNLQAQKFDADGQIPLLYRDSQMKFQVPNSRGRQLLSHEIKFKW